MTLFRFKKLTVKSIPGINDEFCLDDINSNINIVVGPNGSGKTSTRRALDAVLWPDKSNYHKRKQLNVVAETEFSEVSYNTHLQFGSQTSFKDGRVCDPISFGRPELKEQYHLSLHDLVQDDGEQFAKFIADLSVGGVDLDVCSDAIGAKSKHSSSLEDIRAYNRAKGDIVNLKKKDAENREIELQITSMNDSVESLEKRLSTRSVYLSALEHLDAREARDAARKYRDSFPVEIEKIKGGEFESLNSVEAELELISQKRSKLAFELNAVKKNIGESVVGKSVKPATIYALNSYVNDLAEARSRIKDAQVRVNRCESKVNELYNQLFELDVNNLNVDDFPELKLSFIEDFIRISKELNKIDGEINQLNA